MICTYIHTECDPACQSVGMGFCYGLSDTECCSYYDEGVCTGSCRTNQEPDSSGNFECVCTDFWREPECIGIYVVVGSRFYIYIYSL